METTKKSYITLAVTGWLTETLLLKIGSDFVLVTFSNKRAYSTLWALPPY
jgi:hypothetical protein